MLTTVVVAALRGSRGEITYLSETADRPILTLYNGQLASSDEVYDIRDKALEGVGGFERVPYQTFNELLLRHGLCKEGVFMWSPYKPEEVTGWKFKNTRTSSINLLGGDALDAGSDTVFSNTPPPPHPRLLRKRLRKPVHHHPREAYQDGRCRIIRQIHSLQETVPAPSSGGHPVVYDTS